MDAALEVFARAFSQVRSRAYPVIPRHQDGVWILADTPHRPKARAAELITATADPDLLLRVGGSIPAKRWSLALAVPAHQSLESAARLFKSHGWSRFSTEPFFTLEPAKANLCFGHDVRRIDSLDMVRHIQKISKAKHIELEHVGIPDAPNRLYACFKEGEPVGWVSSLRIGALGTWVSNLFVQHSHRSQGVGAALMSTLLQDNPDSLSVLAASSDGARLYPKLGYDRIADLILFRPPGYGR